MKEFKKILFVLFNYFAPLFVIYGFPMILVAIVLLIASIITGHSFLECFKN